MSCPNCHTDLPSSTRFCPGCGSPGQVAVETRQVAVPTPRGARGRRSAGLGPDDPYPADPAPPGGSGGSSRVGPATGETAVLAGPGPADPEGPSLSDRIAPAADVARDRARGWARRFGQAPVEIRAAVVGAVLTVLAFLLFPYAGGFGPAVELSGRLWWRPIAAVAAAVLVVTALRRSAPDETRRVDSLLAAVVVSAAGVAEAGLLGLLAGDVARPRAGFYGMLLGLVIVLVAAVRAARRVLR